MREMVVKCPSCGAENPDYGFYCGRCAKELPRVPGVSRSEPAEQIQPITQRIWESPPPPDAMVAIAINVRRIFVILVLTLFLTLGTYLVSWWISYFWENNYQNPSDLRAVFAIWAAVSALVIAFGLYYAIFKKRVTKL
jgi:hypothetical protein